MYTKQHVVCTIYTLLADLNVWVKMFSPTQMHIWLQKYMNFHMNFKEINGKLKGTNNTEVALCA